MSNMPISLSNITFGFADTTILHDLNITFEPGKLHAIIGPNGSGKSTLLDIMAGHQSPWSGSVSISDKPLKDFSPTSLAKEVATVPQEFNFNFPFPVLDAILMGRHPYIPRFSRPSEDDMAIVRSAMQTMDLTDLEHRAMSDLSGGEKQRTVFARALAQSTPYLLLDEPTSSMDIRHALAAMEELRTLAHTKGRTIVTILHDLNLAAAFCDEIAILHKGRLHTQGPATTALTPDTIMAVFSVQAEVTLAPNAKHPVITYISKDTV